MASVFIGLNRGTQSPLGVDQVSVSTPATSSTDVELRMDLTKGLTRKDIYNIIEVFENWIRDGRLDIYFH